MADKIISKLNLLDISGQTDQDRIDRAHNQIELVDLVKVTQLGKDIDKKNLNKELAVTFYFRTVSTNGHEYFPIVRFQENMTSKSPVRISCTCPDFNYRVAYALNSYDALYNPSAFADKVLNEPPTRTNPKVSPYMCKHLIIALKAMQEEGLIA